jgi:tetratricopeptide (TPR) repeat protein
VELIMVRLARFVLASLVLGAAPLFAQPPALGRIDFPTSGKAEAQPHFVRGMLLLHSFEFEDAAAAFKQARTEDRGFAMAYWGEALSYTHPLWRERRLEPARAVLAALAPTPEARQAKAPTAREKAYLAAVDALYASDDYLASLRSYEQAMARVSREFPQDDEAAALHAVSILATNVERRDFAVDMRAAAIVEDIFVRNPEHPGALHYMIHAYDNPMHAPLGLRAARRYARIAPGAAHALHMTSHIFLAMGMWDDEVKANEESWTASAARVKAKSLAIDDNGFHAYLWLAYGYLQQGRYADARQVLDQTYAFAKASGSRRTTSHHALARAAYIVETQRWQELPPALDLPTSPISRAAELAAEGIAAARAGRLERADAIVQEIARTVATATASEPHHGGPSPLSPNDRASFDILQKQLSGLVRYVRGQRDEGLALVAQAADAEDALSYEYGPPIPAKPSRELLGELLLDAGRAADAQRAFAAALERTPGRALALIGLTRAATKAGDATTAAEARAALKTNWHRADPDVQRAGTM